MKTSITSGMSEQEKKEMRGEFISCFRLRERYTAMLEKDIENLQDSMESVESFSSPNWSLEQATKAGEIRAKRKLILLMK